MLDWEELKYWKNESFHQTTELVYTVKLVLRSAFQTSWCVFVSNCNLLLTLRRVFFDKQGQSHSSEYIKIYKQVYLRHNPPFHRNSLWSREFGFSALCFPKRTVLRYLVFNLQLRCNTNVMANIHPCPSWIFPYVISVCCVAFPTQLSYTENVTSTCTKLLTELCNRQWSIL